MYCFGTRRCRWLLLLAVAVGSARGLAAQETTDRESYIRIHYAKREVLIPMRDGTRLHTAVYSPRDRTKTYPLLIKRTPYSCAPYGEDKYPAALGPSWHFVKSGYIFVNQDVRGRFLSEGTFQQVTPHVPDKRGPQDVDESTDAYDTIEWLLQNTSGHNGRVGMAGISYPGFYAAAGMIDAHPALVAVSPQAPVADWYFDDFLHHGTFFLAHAFRWLNNNAHDRKEPTTEKPKPHELPSLDGYNLFLDAGSLEEISKRYLKDEVPFWTEMMQHPDRDEFWQRRNLLPHLQRVAPHVMVVTGWYDAEDLYGSFESYRAIEAQNPNCNNTLVVGPWIHGGWSRDDGGRLGDVTFGSNTSQFYQAEIEFPFFEKHLKEKDLPGLEEATVFETGSNVWRSFDAWPPRGTAARSYYLQADGGLAPAAPAPSDPAQPATGGDGFDEFVSDPARPVPFSEKITTSMLVEYMNADQRFAARRPDVLVYQTPPLEADLTVAGPIPVELWVSTTGTDADFIVKLIDVFPDGADAALLPNYQMLVRSEAFRGRYHQGYEQPHPFTPHEPTPIRFPLLDVLHRFQKGHRIMVQIQSTWFPLVDRNPQQFVPNIFLAKPEDFRPATHRVWRTARHATRLDLGVVEVSSHQP